MSTPFYLLAKADQVELVLFSERTQQAMDAKPIAQAATQNLVREYEYSHAGLARMTISRHRLDSRRRIPPLQPPNGTI